MGSKAQRIDVDLAPDRESPGRLRCHVRVLDPALSGLKARLELLAAVEVDDDRPVNAEKVLHKHALTLGAGDLAFPIDCDLGGLYTHDGEKVRLRLRTRVVVDDGILFDTQVREDQRLPLLLKPAVSSDTATLIEPKDLYDFFANLKAIPAGARALTLVLAIAGGIVMAVNAAVGAHDQFVPESRTWMYSHTDSDGDGQSPLFASLALSGGLGGAIWFAMRRQLRRYAEFRLRPRTGRIRRGDRVPLRSLVHGKPRVPLEDVRLRVVACNMECGEYKRGSGTKTRTVSFRHPVRGVLLYDRRVARIPAGMPIHAYFDGEVDFTPMFRALYPPCMIGGSHGIDVHWEVQLLHPQYVDHELVGPSDAFAREDFLDA